MPQAAVSDIADRRRRPRTRRSLVANGVEIATGGDARHPFEQPMKMGRADPRRPRQSLQGRSLTCVMNLGAGRLHQGAVAVVEGGFLRLAPAAGTKARSTRLHERLVKTNVFGLRLSRRTGGPAVDACRHDRIPEDPLRAWISRMNLSEPTSSRRRRRGSGNLGHGHGVFQKARFREDAAGARTHYD